MPSGIILSSSSHGATKEAVEKVLADNGYEADKPEEEKKAADDTADEPNEEQGKVSPAEENSEELTEEAHQADDKPKLSRRQRAAERDRQRIATLEREIRELREQGTKKAEPAPELKAPKREDFKTDEDFEDAKFDFRYKQRRAKEEADTAQQRLQEQLKESFTAYQTAVATFQEEHDDWNEVVDSSVAISDPVYFSIVELGSDGPAVTYYLGQHPEEIERLAGLTPHRVTIEIARLADKLNKPQKREAAAVPPKPKPKLPEPVQPVSGSATQSSLTSRDAAANRNYRAFKVAQRAGR